jgi:Na+-translocating ferredoxin:NAD+ oxidoreductase subunit G
MKYFKVVFVLAVVAAFSAGILSLADIATKDKIEKNRQQEINRSIENIITEARRIEQDGQSYRVYDNSGRLAGYVFIVQGQAYQGDIEIICGISPDFKIIRGIEILSSVETPGLGARIAEDSFKDQFKGLKVQPEIVYTKSEPSKDNEIKAITGATVSSRAVVNILNKKIEELRKKTEE